MLDFTPVMRHYLRFRPGSPTVSCRRVEYVQRRVLKYLLSQLGKTEYGRVFGVSAGMSYEDFRNALPIVEYPAIREYVMKMVAGKRDILWPGKTTRFAQSSGTSDGQSKYIPITPEGLFSNHYRGTASTLARYLKLHPESRIFSGRAFILGGSFANALTLPRGVRVGDLSAHLIDRIPETVNFFRTPSKKTALTEDWSLKLPALVREASAVSVSNISGVPSWFLTVLKEILSFTGKSEIHQVWSNLEVFFHGGISFTPYREEYNRIIDPARMNYLENYNASEGFFAVQDTLDPENGMELLMDCGVFYEFIPAGSGDSAAIPAWEVEAGETYTLVISSVNGLWRYIIGDMVRIESLDPLRISIAGRTKSYINAFGEEVMVYNADAAVTAACAETSAAVADYTAAPVFARDNSKGHHQWLIEFTVPPQDMGAFAAVLDTTLRSVNSDYDAKRSGDIFLAAPEIIPLPAGTFNTYLAMTGKLGGQRKVPRLSNDRHIADTILEITKSK